MENQTALLTASQSAARAPYAPPAASFVPLKLEERLGGCGKLVEGGGPCNLAPELS